MACARTGAVAEAGLPRRTLHGRPVDAGHGPLRGDPGQASAHDDQRQGGPLSAGSCEQTVPRFPRLTACGWPILRMWRPGPAPPMSLSSSTLTPGGSSAGEPVGQRTPISCSTPWSKRSMTEGLPGAAASFITPTGQPRRIQAVVATPERRKLRWAFESVDHTFLDGRRCRHWGGRQ